MKKNNEKTNVMRILDQNKINYQSYDYLSTGAISGIEVANALNENPNQVFKTLVTIGNTKNYYVFLVPVNKELDLKKAAKAVNEKNNQSRTAASACGAPAECLRRKDGVRVCRRERSGKGNPV